MARYVVQADDRRIAWWRQQAGEHGECAADLARHSAEISLDGCDAASAFAREAAHFGNMALDAEFYAGKAIHVTDANTPFAEFHWVKES